MAGASGRIGTSIVETLARYGADVGMMDRNIDHLIEIETKINTKPGGSVFAIRGNIWSHSDMENAIWQTVEVFGALHLAINNMGVVLGTIPIDEDALYVREDPMPVNPDGVFGVIKDEVMEMLKSGKGSIVNVCLPEKCAMRSCNSGPTIFKRNIENLLKTIAKDDNDGIKIKWYVFQQ